MSKSFFTSFATRFFSLLILGFSLYACGNKYDSQTEFVNGAAGVSLNGKYGFINQDGQEICAPKYEAVSNFVGDLAKVKMNNKYGFVDRSGKEVVAPKYDKVYTFSKGVAKIEINGKFGFINEEGKEVVEPKYDAVNYNIIGQYFEVAENGQRTQISRKETKI